MVFAQRFHLFGLISLLPLFIKATEDTPEPHSLTIVNFGEKTGRARYYSIDGQVSANCTENEIKTKQPKPFSTFLFNDDSSVKLRMSCFVQCTKTSDKQANYKFINDNVEPLRGDNTDIGRVWCNNTVEWDHSVWNSIEETPQPDSDKGVDPIPPKL